MVQILDHFSARYCAYENSFGKSNLSRHNLQRSKAGKIVQNPTGKRYGIRFHGFLAILHIFWWSCFDCKAQRKFFFLLVSKIVFNEWCVQSYNFSGWAPRRERERKNWQKNFVTGHSAILTLTMSMKWSKFSIKLGNTWLWLLTISSSTFFPLGYQ